MKKRERTRGERKSQTLRTYTRTGAKRLLILVQLWQKFYRRKCQKQLKKIMRTATKWRKKKLNVKRKHQHCALFAFIWITLFVSYPIFFSSFGRCCCCCCCSCVCSSCVPHTHKLRKMCAPKHWIIGVSTLSFRFLFMYYGIRVCVCADAIFLRLYFFWHFWCRQDMDWFPFLQTCKYIIDKAFPSKWAIHSHRDGSSPYNNNNKTRQQQQRQHQR